MISMDKNLMTTVGVVACLLVTIYLFRELTKAKDDVEQLKNVSMHLMQMNEPPRPAPMPMPMHANARGEGNERRRDGHRERSAGGGGEGDRRRKLNPLILGFTSTDT
jgi:hypothetical protein